MFFFLFNIVYVRVLDSYICYAVSGVTVHPLEDARLSSNCLS